jgi:alkylresorcinol/alkylpyrone synthase
VLAEHWVRDHGGLRDVLDVFVTSGVRTRHLAAPLEERWGRRSFAERNARYVEEARALDAQVARRALEDAGRAPADVTHVVLVTSTGIATPSLDAHLVNDLSLPGSVRRVPVWGLGCGGGGAGLGLAADLARSAPDAVVLLVVVELCSLAFVPGDLTKRNVIAAALFGDGAAAAVVAGDGRGLELGAHRTTTWSDTLDIMGWEVTEEGLGLVLSRNLPAFARTRLGPVLEDLRGAAGWPADRVPGFLAIHPGGPKVLAALGESLAVPDALLEPARRVLARYGDMSAPTFLYVLEEILRETPEPATAGLYSVMGPGFTCDMGVLSPAEA